MPLHQQGGHAQAREQDGGGQADRPAAGDEDFDVAHAGHGSPAVLESAAEVNMNPATIVIRDLVTGPIPPRPTAEGSPNVLHTRVAEVVDKMGPPPWSRRIIADERNLVTLIASAPGGGNRPHWHREFDEWWVVLAGRLQWELTGGIVVDAVKDHIVWVPRGTVHHIRNVGTELSLRLAVAMPPANHYFSPCEQCGYTDDGPREWCA
jgi:mannose-6-phosphate isomerase-like protein (cupin superfamily)